MRKWFKRIMIGFGIIVLFFAILIGYFVYKDLKQEEVLKSEVVRLSNKDLVRDNYNISIKTSGDYAYIESAIKKYYKELSDNVKTLNSVLDNEELLDILSIDNLEKNRPSFASSFDLIQSVKNKSSEAIFNISSLCDKSYIESLIDKDKVSDYYVKFYRKLMYTDDDLEKLAKTKEEMEEISSNLNLFMDKIEEILNMLKNHNDDWFVENGQLYFENGDLVNEYNTLYKELKEIANSKFDSGKDFSLDNGGVSA